MKDIFANLYNKVFSFFHQAENKHNESAKDVACNRLKLVLMQDRTNLSPAIMERMRGELIDLLSKYLELDRELLDLNLAQEDEQMALMLSIPVIRAKDETEIEELLRQEDAEKETESSETDDETEESDNNDEDTEIEETEPVKEDDDDSEIKDTEDSNEEPEEINSEPETEEVEDETNTDEKSKDTIKNK